MTFGNACGGKRLESLKHAVLFLLHGFRLMQRVTRLPPPIFLRVPQVSCLFSKDESLLQIIVYERENVCLFSLPLYIIFDTAPGKG